MEDTFLEYLKSRGIIMNQSHEQAGTAYTGIFELSEDKSVKFGILFFRVEDIYHHYQIVFDNIVMYEDKGLALQKLNELNLQGQGYYYLCMNMDGSVLLRTVGSAKDYEKVYQIFVAGARTARDILPLLEV